MREIKFKLNGQEIKIFVEDKWTLLYVLREKLGLTGAKEGCGTGDCGACKVLLDGEPVNSCTTSIKKVEGKCVLTIEGLGNGDCLDPIQQAFIDAGAVQCGFCTPGMIMTTKALLENNPEPSEQEIRESFKNNLCRCTGYVKIVDAVKLASKEIKGGTSNV